MKGKATRGQKTMHLLTVELPDWKQKLHGSKMRSSRENRLEQCFI